MQQLSAENGNGNKSSCSFSLAVSPLKARWDSFIRLHFPSQRQESVCQQCDGLQVYLSWQRWISERGTSSVQPSCQGATLHQGPHLLNSADNAHVCLGFILKRGLQNIFFFLGGGGLCCAHFSSKPPDQFGSQCAWTSITPPSPSHSHVWP